MSAKKLSADDFNGAVTDSIVEFYADDCAFCRMMDPLIDKVSQKYPDVKFFKVNVDTERNLSDEYGIMSVPTLLRFKNGKVVERKIGKISIGEIISMI